MTPTLFCPAGGEIVLGQIQSITGFSFSTEWGVCPTGLRLKKQHFDSLGVKEPVIKIKLCP